MRYNNNMNTNKSKKFKNDKQTKLHIKALFKY